MSMNTFEVARCVALLREYGELMADIMRQPAAGNLSLDVGMLNDTLMESAKIIREHEQAVEQEATPGAALGTALATTWGKMTAEERAEMRSSTKRFLQQSNGSDPVQAAGWIAIDDRLPTSVDANAAGMVEWLRSGRECMGLITEEPPVDATHWRRSLPTGCRP